MLVAEEGLSSVVLGAKTMLLGVKSCVIVSLPVAAIDVGGALLVAGAGVWVGTDSVETPVPVGVFVGTLVGTPVSVGTEDGGETDGLTVGLVPGPVIPEVLLGGGITVVGPPVPVSVVVGGTTVGPPVVEVLGGRSVGIEIDVDEMIVVGGMSVVGGPVVGGRSVVGGKSILLGILILILVLGSVTGILGMLDEKMLVRILWTSDGSVTLGPIDKVGNIPPSLDDVVTTPEGPTVILVSVSVFFGGSVVFGSTIEETAELRSETIDEMIPPPVAVSVFDGVSVSAFVGFSVGFSSPVFVPVSVAVSLA